MLFYDAPNPAPNPRRVRIYLAERGIEVPMKPLSIPAREQKSPEFTAINPLGQVPTLVLDDGTAITESVSICRWFEAEHGQSPLFGRTPTEIALIDMHLRRAEMVLMTPVGMVWAHTHPFTAKAVVPQYKDFGESNRAKVASAMGFFDRQLQGREWLASEDYSMADIVLLTTIDFAGFIGIEMPEDAANLRAWHARASARPSARA
ncbi:glutathione S-transferase family protein [Sphingomonas gilva]|uniref:Glutathione S-transferase family protein n=1 Tax=Sphingomonas gilva TaxID=2305907 RepID=A0A396RJI2_9SPHN|nr:glutathione S-transferase family protein [Sphingomonas gilva]RHW16280.1 glutathione S-transferase family protein [Sphingomonas gilva]